MKVQDLMTSDAKVCRPETDLATAAMLMWDGDFGTLPVVADGGRVVGMITDRDICIAAATNQRAASNIAVGEVITGKLFSCAPETDVRDALKLMQHEKVRRLPVIGAEGALQGILSLNDVVLKAEETKNNSSVSYADVMKTFKSICGQHELLPLEQQQSLQRQTATA
jgi:CBS domain-containing protein